MTDFVFPFAGFVFVFIALAAEIQWRKLAGLSPAGWIEAFRFGQKKTTPDPRYSAAIFAALSLFGFGAWESLLRALLGRANSGWVFALGAILAGWYLYFRKRAFDATVPAGERGRFSKGDLWVLVLAWTLLMGAGLSLLLAPWLAFRTKFLAPARGLRPRPT